MNIRSIFIIIIKCILMFIITPTVLVLALNFERVDFKFATKVLFLCVFAAAAIFVLEKSKFASNATNYVSTITFIVILCGNNLSLFKNIIISSFMIFTNFLLIRIYGKARCQWFPPRRENQN